MSGKNPLFPPSAYAANLTSVLGPVYGRHWRDELRKRLGNRSEKLWDIVIGLAEGKAQVTTDPATGECHRAMPTPDVQLRAAIWLGEMLHGKAVTQSEQTKAEAEAGDIEAVRALSDEELETRARSALERGLRKLDEKRTLSLVESVTEASIVDDSERDS